MRGVHESTAAGAGAFGFPAHSGNAFAIALGGGIDVKVVPSVWVRVIQFGYMGTHFASSFQNQQPADVLLLDEPTNDLDIPTLEILEESLLEYRGALVLVTHDRYVLHRVTTVVLGLDGMGKAERFADYSQWEEWQSAQEAAKKMRGLKDEPRSKAAGNGARRLLQRRRSLSYQERQGIGGNRGADRRGGAGVANPPQGAGGSLPLFSLLPRCRGKPAGRKSRPFHFFVSFLFSYSGRNPALTWAFPGHVRHTKKPSRKTV